MIFQERKWAFEKRCLLPPLWTADPLIGLGWTRTTGEPAARSFVVARTWKIQKEIHTKSIQIQIHFGLKFLTLCADINWLKTLTKKIRKKPGRSSHFPPRLLVTKSTVRVVQNTFTTAITKYRRTFPTILVFSTKIPSSKRLWTPIKRFWYSNSQTASKPSFKALATLLEFCRIQGDDTY